MSGYASHLLLDFRTTMRTNALNGGITKRGEDTLKIEFQIEPPTSDEVQGLSIPMDEDLYAPLLKNVRWIFKKSP